MIMYFFHTFCQAKFKYSFCFEGFVYRTVPNAGSSAHKNCFFHDNSVQPATKQIMECTDVPKTVFTFRLYCTDLRMGEDTYFVPDCNVPKNASGSPVTCLVLLNVFHPRMNMIEFGFQFVLMPWRRKILFLKYIVWRKSFI